MSSDDTIKLNITAETRVDGADKSEAAIRALQEQVDALGESGDITRKQLNKLSRAFESIQKESGGAGGGVKKQTSAFQALQREIQAATRDLQEFAAKKVAGGSTTPQADATNRMSSSTADRILVADEATRVNATATAKAVKDAYNSEMGVLQTARKEKRAALKAALSEQEKLIRDSNGNMTAEESKAAKKRVMIAQRELKEVRESIRELSKAREKATLGQKTAVNPNDKALDARRTTLGGRNYDNSSVQIDSAIDQRSKESSNFAKRLKADMEERVKAEKKVQKVTEDTAKVNHKTDMSVRDLATANGGLRYALYDVARTAGMISAAITGIGVAAVATAASFEASFTQVERTTMASEAELNKVHKGLMQITQDTPQTWGFVNEVASVGAQLNIATESLVMFTDQTTKFSSVTGITAEASAMAFGSLGQLLKLSAGEFESLGSAIAYVGVNSVATDQEIVTMAQRLGASAENAGMTAQEVVALSGAFASLRIAPERAQGVMEVYFKVLNTAIAEGGARLDSFAQLSGMSTDAVREMVATDPTAYFRALSQGLSSLDPVSMTSALSDLGLSGIRAGEVFTRVSGNLEVFDDALSNSNEAWSDGTHLSEAYGKVVDDLASKWTIFTNAIAQVADTIGRNLLPGVGFVLDLMTDFAQNLSTFLDHPTGKIVAWITIAIAAAAALATGLAAGIAIILASLAATSFAVKELGLTAGKSAISIRGLSAALTSVGVTAGVSTKALKLFKVALASTGIGLIVVALGTLGAAFMNLEHPANAAAASFDKLFGDGAGLQGALTEDAKAFDAAGRQLGDSFTAITYNADQTTSSVGGYSDGMKAAADLVGVTLPAFESTTDVFDDQTKVIGANTLAWMENALVVSEAFQKHATNEQFAADFKQLGLTMEDVLKAAAEGGEQGVYDLYARATAASGKGGELLSNWWGTFWGRFGRAATLWWETLKKQFDAIVALDFDKAGKNLIEYGKSWNEVWGSTVYNKASTDLAKAATGIVNQASHAQEALENLNGGYDGEDNVDNLEKTGDAAKKLVYTLVDYANDLASVWDRAFDIRFSGEQTFDAITSSLHNMRKAAEDTARKIRDLRNDIAGMSSDIRIQEYFLSVAIEYGDTKRAEAIEAKLLKLRAELSDKTAELQKEEDKSSMSLEGNSEAAIENRKNIQQLVQQYQSHMKALAASGMEVDQLALKTEELRQDFIAQATQLGYSRAEIDKYAKAFDDVRVAINGVPRKITVEANADPALQALNEFMAKARDTVGQGVSVPIKGIVDTGSSAASGRIAGLISSYHSEKAIYDKGISSGRASLQSLSLLDQNLYRIAQELAALGYARGSYSTGGYTGRGGMYDPAGVVHRGEYVIPKRDVNQATGRPYADALGRHMGGLPSRATAPSTGANGGSNVVSLSAGSIQALAHSVSKVLVLDGKVLADSSTRQYRNGTVLGAY